MNSQDKYIKLYKQKREDSLQKWGYYYPPIDWVEFETWNNNTYLKYLSTENWDNEAIKTRTYIDLLDDDKEFGFYIAFQNRDFETLNNVLYQTSRRRLLITGMTASGTDHAISLMDVLSAFVCNDFDLVKYFFPQELPLSKGLYYTEVSANLLKVLYYKDDHLNEESVQKAQKFLSKKITIWEELTVKYFLSLINKNVVQSNTCLQGLCSAYQKIGDFSKLEKCFAKELHGLYRFAKIVDEEFYKRIELPAHDCFFKEFEAWQKEHNYPKGQLFYIYPKELDYMNRIFKAEIPTVTLTEVKVGNQKQIYKDVDKFALDLAENVKNVR